MRCTYLDGSVIERELSRFGLKRNHSRPILIEVWGEIHPMVLKGLQMAVHPKDGEVVVHEH